MIRLFVGHDPREAVAFDVFVASVLERTSKPVAITPLALSTLAGVYRESHTDGSNAFIYSRFLVPYLCDFTGWAIFADGDMLCRDDLAELWDLRDPNKAVQVVKHDYRTKHPTKYLGARNDDYPRKNWSSVIIWNCGHPDNAWLTPENVAASTGRLLHRFSWLDDDKIGELPLHWNWLVTEYSYSKFASLVHYTLGTPCFEEYAECDYADEWHDTLKRLLHVPGADGI